MVAIGCRRCRDARWGRRHLGGHGRPVTGRVVRGRDQRLAEAVRLPRRRLGPRIPQPSGCGWYTHCGVREAQFAGSYWVTQPALGAGSAPAVWGDPQQEGTMRLLDADTAVFRDDAGHQVRFTRRGGASRFLLIRR